jgi:transcriptional regulator with XRE-family HTH domain
MTEHDKARRWRESVGLAPAQLAKLTGYSISSIFWFERGLTPERKYLGQRPAKKNKREIDPRVWLRYKRACHSVATRQKFDWK